MSVSTMSARPEPGRNDGGRGRGRAGRGGGSGGRGRGNNRSGGRATNTFKNKIDGMKSTDVFLHGKPEDVAKFAKTWEALVEHVRIKGEKECDTLADAMERMELPTIDEPPEPAANIPDPNNAGQVIVNPRLGIETIKFEAIIKRMPDREAALARQTAATFAEAFACCDSALQNKLKALPNWEVVYRQKDIIQLGIEIRSIVIGVEQDVLPMYGLVQSTKNLMLYYQQHGQSDVDYYEGFNGMWDAQYEQGSRLGYVPHMIELRADVLAAAAGRADPNDDDNELAEEEIGEEMKVCYFISGANSKRHKECKSYLKNEWIVGKRNSYPKTMPDALALLQSYQTSGSINTRAAVANDDQVDGLSYFQEGTEEVDVNEDEEEVVEEGVTMVQNGHHSNTGQAKSRRKRSKKKKKNVSFDEATLNNDTKPDGSVKKEDAGGKPPCPHCGSEDHGLVGCDKITLEQLEQIHCQLAEATEEEEDVVEGEMHYQEGGMLLAHDAKSAPAIRKAGITRNMLILDTATTNELMTNSQYLTGVHKSKEALLLHTNAGTSRTNWKGKLGGIPFWLDRGGIANVISLRALEKRFPEVAYNSKMNGGAFVVTTHDGKKIVFKRCTKTGFPYIDLDEDDDMGVMLVQAKAAGEVKTIRKSYEGYTLKEVERAIRARKAQAQAGHPSEATMKKEVSHKSESSLYRDCPIVAQDIKNANAIFGPSTACLKGKQVRKKPERVDPFYVSIPPNLIDLHKYVTLVGDVMFVNGIPFLVTMSRRIRFITVQHVPDRKASALANVMKQVMNLYSRAGFVCQTALMDGEFEPLKAKLVGSIEVNTTAKNEHVGEIERKIRSLKDRCRCMVAAMPFAVLPNIVIKAMVTNAVMLMNAHIDKQGVSTELSPREIVLRWQLSFAKHCKAVFGSLVEAYDDEDITNTMKERAVTGIYLGATGNMQGTSKILNLKTGKLVKRRNITLRPMPDSVIKHINKWGLRNKQSGRIVFSDRNQREYDWNEENLVADNAPEEDSAPFPAVPAEEPGIDLSRDMESLSAPVVEDPTPSFEDLARAAASNSGIVRESTNVAQESSGVNNSINIRRIASNNNIAPADADEIEATTEDDEEEVDIENEEHVNRHSHDDDTEHGEESDTDETYQTADEEAQSDAESVMEALESDEASELNEDSMHIDEDEDVRRRSERVRVEPDKYEPEDFRRGMSNLNIGEGDDAPIIIGEDESEMFGMIMMQVSLKQGYKLFGEERASEGALKEVKQLHDLNVFFPRDPKSLSREERIKALSSLLFLKEKSSGQVKGRACINGAPQRNYIPREEATSPTVNKDSIFITSTVGAFQGRKFATSDLPGAFCNTPLTDETVIMILRGELCELMVRADPKLYRKYVTTDKRGKPILYVQLTKALYGLLRAAVLFYRKLRKELEDYGFTVNPYDPCVANKMVRMTVVENGVEKDVLETDAQGKVILDENEKPKVKMVQLTVVWHVDDLHMSCENDFEITKLWSYLNKLYSNNVKVTRGDVHEYLGMEFDYSEPGVFKVSMIPYIDKIFEDFPEDIKSSAPAPHTDYLFKIREESKRKKLETERAVAFHHATAQLLFLSQRARRDIMTAVSFLTSRVKDPDEDDWGKLKRVLKYLKGTRSMPLRIKADSLEKTLWDIDASHAVHEDCKGQTGGGMTLGEGATMSHCWKQKGNTRSSTETEVVGLHDSLPNVLWSLYFMQEQGYGTRCARIYQDNNSAILLEVNGRSSSTKRTKHIKNKYFYVKHCVDEGDIEIRKRDTEEMWSDVWTKPKVGAPFKKDRSKIMNCPLEWPDETIHGSP